ncbi:hypothetical protein Tco_0765323 [Tanacetum coccineum]
MEKLKSENVSLEFQVQSLIKERENVKTKYQKLFDSIKKTCAQTQGEINELFENVKQKTYAYADVRVQNQDLLLTIFELKAKLKTVENGLSVTSSVRIPSNRDSSFKNSVISNTKNSSKTVEVSDRTNKKPDVASKNVGLDTFVVQIVLWIVDSGYSKHMMGDCSLLKRHNLFSVGQFCDGDLEVAFRSKACYVHNLEGDDLLTGDRESNLYTISIPDMAGSSPVCLMSKASFVTMVPWFMGNETLPQPISGTINDLTKHDLVDGLPKFKYSNDHLCSACERGKSKKASHPPKLIPKDSSEFDGNALLTPYDALYFSEAESSTALDPSNMHEFHQVQPSTHIWTKAHSLEQVIGDPSKLVMTRNRLQTDSELSMSDHSWIESMQDELHQFERLDV